MTTEIVECELTELDPDLLRLLEGQLSSDQKVIVCCQKTTDGTLEAFVLTKYQAIRCIYENNPANTRQSGIVEKILYRDLASIEKKCGNQVPFVGCPQILLWSDNPGSTPSIQYSFITTDNLYTKFIQQLTAQWAHVRSGT